MNDLEKEADELLKDFVTDKAKRVAVCMERISFLKNSRDEMNQRYDEFIKFWEGHLAEVQGDVNSDTVHTES